MRLLFDANVSPRLVPALQDVFTNAAHVFDCGGIHNDDSLIWEYAKVNDFAIVTKDGDFQGLSMVRGAPPKVVWLRVGMPEPPHSRDCCALGRETFFGSGPILSHLSSSWTNSK